MPGQQVWAYPEGLQQPEQRHLDREDRGLGVLGAVQHIGPGVEEQLPRRDAEVRVHGRAGRVERLRVTREHGVQLASHSRALASLPGEQEGQLPWCDGAAHDVRATVALTEPGQAGEQPGGVGAQDHGPVRARRGGSGRGQSQSSAVETGAGTGRAVGDLVQEQPSLTLQGVRAATGDDEGDGGLKDGLLR